MIRGSSIAVYQDKPLPIDLSPYLRELKLPDPKFDWLPRQEGHRMEIRHFTECLEQGLLVRVQPVESLRIQKIIDAIYASSRVNREVAIK